MATPSLSELLTIPTQDDVLNQEVLPELQKRSVRITDWIPGGVYRAMAYLSAFLRLNLRVAVAAMVAAGFEDYAFGFATPPPDIYGNVIDVTDWAPVIAQQRYGVIQIAASYTQRTITLTNTAGQYIVQPGNMMIQFPSGNKYVIDGPVGLPTGPVTIPAAGSVQARFRSQFTSDTKHGLNYNDPSGQTLQLVTSQFAGVTATNPAPTFSPVAQAGSGLGTVTPSGSPTGGAHTVAVKIVNSGNVTGSTVGWQYSVDGGAWSATQTVSSLLVGSGITVTLADNGGNPAFTIGSVYYFTTPGSDITQVGADVETPQSLGLRCRGLWPSLAFAKDSAGNWIPTSPTQAAYIALALSANSQVRIVFVGPGSVNNELKLVVAGQGGSPLPPSVVASLQSFFNHYSMLTDVVVVSTSTARTITLAGLVITCKSGQLASAQTALTAALQLYLGGVDTRAPLSINGLVDYDYIIALARTTPGVTHVSGTLTINTVAADFQLPVTPGAYESASWTQSAATAFGWNTV